jgi:hypothetical protein
VAFLVKHDNDPLLSNSRGLNPATATTANLWRFLRHFPSPFLIFDSQATDCGFFIRYHHFPSNILGFSVKLGVLCKIGVFVGILCMVLV